MKTQQNGEELRKLLKVSSTGKLIFPAGSTMVIMDTKQNKQQQFFMKHKEEIICAAIHPKGNVIASGTYAYKGETKIVEICVWNTETKNIQSHISDFHVKGISMMEFSPDGSLLLTAGKGF